MSGRINRFQSFIQSKPVFLLFIVFIIIQAILFIRIGTFTGLEAEKYIAEGKLLFTNGHLSESKYFFYLPVILLVFVCTALNLPFFFIVIIQVLLSWIGIVCFFRLGKQLSNTLIAFFSALLLILFIPFQVWNFYLYSDSIFLSLTLIFVYLVYKYRDSNLKGLLIILISSLILVFTRPNALLILPPLMVYFLFTRYKTASIKWASIAIGLFLIIASYFLVNTLYRGGGELDALKPFIEEHIICFVPTKTDAPDLDIVRTGNAINDLTYYAVHNPSHFAKLTGLKLVSFFNLTRPYYSTLHNLALLIFMLPVYVLALLGGYKFIRDKKNRSLFLVSLIVLYPLAISLQCDDWHSRFTMVIIPYLIFLAVYGFDGLQKRMLFQKKS